MLEQLADIRYPMVLVVSQARCVRWQLGQPLKMAAAGAYLKLDVSNPAAPVLMAKR